MSADSIEVSALSAVSDIALSDWDACACPEAEIGRPVDPFTSHRFLSALERSGSVGPGTGWQPRPLVARRNGQIIAVAPLYVKADSQGEYIFDHSWADAWERAGGKYYPKLQIAVPFTPVTGRRLLTRPGEEDTGRSALLSAAAQIADRAGLSSVHVTFCEAAEIGAGEAIGYLPRLTQQFHWENRNYTDFEAFLFDLASRKRKMIRKERATAQSFGGSIRRLTGNDIEPHHWDAFWRFYQDTGARKWGRPYLTRAFFDEIHHTLRDDILLVIAERGGRPIAGALNFIGRDTLFGRYWGCIEDHPCLHFELCYYQAIDHAIETGMPRVEAGAQGEHKLARGYLPSEIHSLHWIGNMSFRRAVAQYLEEERRSIGQEIDVLTSYGPFRHVPADE